MAEKGTKPSDEMAWASAAAAGDVTSPSSGQEASGYAFSQILPHDEFNYILKNGTDWISYLHEGRPRTFFDLPSLISALGAGETGIVDTMDSMHFNPLSEIWSVDPAPSVTATATPGGKNPKSVCTDGLRIYVNLTSGIRAYDSLTGTMLWEQTAAPFDTNAASAICTDGASVFASAGITTGTLYKLDAETGAIDGTWTPYNHSELIHSCATDGTSVFLCGERSPSNNTHARLDYSTGAAVWERDHGVELYDIATDGRSVWVVGNQSATVGDYTDADKCMRRIRYDNGLAEPTAMNFGFGSEALLTCIALAGNVVFVGGEGPGNVPYWASHDYHYPANTNWTNQSLVPAVSNGPIWSIAFDGRGTVYLGSYADAQDSICIFSCSAYSGVVSQNTISPNGSGLGFGSPDINPVFDCGIASTDQACTGLCTDGFRLFSVHGNSGSAAGRRIRAHHMEVPPTLVTRTTAPYKLRGLYSTLAVPHFAPSKFSG